MAAKKDKMLKYKGKPLVRNGNTIYFGDMAEPFVAMLQVLDEQDFKDLTLPKDVSIQILSTDSSLPPNERIKKRAQKKNFYEALKIADIWLERMEP